MGGTPAGAAKAKETNKKKYGADYYKKIGAMGWKNPRSHLTGFALMTEEERKEHGRKGGKKTKEEYRRKVGDTFEIEGVEYKVALVEETTIPAETDSINPGTSE